MVDQDGRDYVPTKVFIISLSTAFIISTLAVILTLPLWGLGVFFFSLVIFAASYVIGLAILLKLFKRLTRK